MGRYGPAPEAAPPPPPPDDPGTSRWSINRKFLAVLASFGMVAAFVFNFLNPAGSGFKDDNSTTTSPSTTAATVVASTSVESTSSTAAPSTTSTTNIPGGVTNR